MDAQIILVSFLITYVSLMLLFVIYILYRFINSTDLKMLKLECLFSQYKYAEVHFFQQMPRQERKQNKS